MASDWSSEPILRMVAGPTPGRVIAIPQGEIVLGRYKDCDAVLTGDVRISKRHAKILRVGDSVLIEDNDSTNGTQVNGTFVRIATTLKDGDHVKICEQVFVYRTTAVTLQEDEDSSRVLSSIEMPSSLRRASTMKAEDKLLSILEISRDLGNTLHLREVLEKTLASLFKIFPQADRGFVLLPRDEGGEPVPQASLQREGVTGPLTLSCTVFAHVMHRGEAILSENLVDDSRFPEARSLSGSDIRWMMGVPLRDQDHRPIGMIQIDTRDQKARFSQEDLDLLVAVAGPIGLALDNAKLHEEIVRFTNVRASLQNAREVQVALLPEGHPDLDGYEFWDLYEPAETVGGDYFGYLPIDGVDGSRRWAITVADVSGKGMPAALMVAKLSSEVPYCLVSEADPIRAAELLNRQLADARFPERLITYLSVFLDPATHRLTIVNAGHMGPMIRRASGKVEIVGEEMGGPPLAVLDATVYRSSWADLGLGDVVILYTDGVTEAMNPEDQCFRLDRLKRAVEAAPIGAEAVGEAIIRAVREHAAGAPQSDDIGIVCFGRV